MKTRTKTLIIYDWMCDLGLTDKQQKLYALIYGYSQDGMSRMTGTAGSIAAWLGCKERNAQYLLRQLEDMGLIRHCVVRTVRKTWTEFWAVLPEDAVRPEKGTKGKIGWADNAKFCVTDYAENCAIGYAKDCVTDKRVISSRDRSIKRSGGGGKNSAPGRAKTTTTTTGFLLDNDGSGLAAGEIPCCRLPWEGEALSNAWAMLMKQPAWRRKSPEALAIVCEEIGKYCSYSDAVYLLRLAVKKGWDDIKDPGAIVADDSEHVPQYPDTAWRAVEL